MTHSNATRRTMEGTTRHPAQPDEVFPLLCPVREREWLAGWDPTIAYSESGVAEPGCVFTTVGPEGALHVWTVSRHDRQAGIVEFVVVATGLYVMKLDIVLQPEAESTLAVWRRAFTALTPAGERAIAALDGGHHDRRIAHLEASINHYPRTGSMLRA
jgi:hypothetical protein